VERKSEKERVGRRKRKKEKGSARKSEGKERGEEE